MNASDRTAGYLRLVELDHEGAALVSGPLEQDPLPSVRRILLWKAEAGEPIPSVANIQKALELLGFPCQRSRVAAIRVWREATAQSVPPPTTHTGDAP